MKKNQFIKYLIKNGCYLKRHGNRHDMYLNSINGKVAPIPRHPEIKESLCKLIGNQLNIK